MYNVKWAKPPTRLPSKCGDAVCRGTFFTGRIGDHESRLFFRTCDCIVSLDEDLGATWHTSADVHDFQEVEVEIVVDAVKPV